MSEGYVLIAWSPSGYTLHELGGEPPHPGDEYEDGDRTLVVTKVGPSPLPGDQRSCAFSVGKD